MRRWWTFSLCIFLASCSNNQDAPFQTFPAKGKLLINGEPAKGAGIFLYYNGDTGGRSVVPQGWTVDDGGFVLSTFGVNDGAPAGEYRVAVKWPAHRKGPGLGPDKLGGKFAKPDSSGLTARIEKGPTELSFDLKAELVEYKPGTERVGKGINRPKDEP